MRSLVKFFVPLSFLFMLSISCSSSDDSSGTGGNLTVTGVIVDENGNPLFDAVVKNGESHATTDVDGMFSLTGVVSKERIVLEIRANGFFDGYRGFSPVSGGTQMVNVMMESKGVPINFNSVAGTTLSNQGGNIVISPNAVMDGDGNTFDGAVKAYVRFHNTADSNFINVMQGGDFAAENTSGNQGVLSSYGFYSVQMEDATGNALNVKTGSTAGFSLPINAEQLASAPATIPLWSFDKLKGIWVQEGTATKSGNKYVGQVSHFSSWNCDRFFDFYTLNGRTVCNGSGISTRITLVSTAIEIGYDLMATSNAEGYFSIRLPLNDPIEATVYGHTGVIYVPAQSTNHVYDIGNIEVTCGGGGTGPGQFTINGSTYNGDCNSVSSANCTSANAIDVSINSSINITTSFAIFNMPTASSGTFAFTNHTDSLGTCNLYAIVTEVQGSIYGSLSGTLTKTGPKSFTFSCVVYEIGSNVYLTVTGNGTYP